MVISKNQLDEISNIKRDQFLKKTLAFLKINFVEWVSFRSEGEVEQYIKEIVAYAQKYNINTERNIVTIIVSIVENNSLFPLPESLSKIITASNEDENVRVELFYLAAVSATYKLVQIKFNNTYAIEAS